MLAQYSALFERDSEMKEVLAQMFRSIFDFHLRALRFFQARKWRQIFKAHVFRNEFLDDIDNLRSHRDMVKTQASLIEFQKASQARIDAQRRHEEEQAQEQLRRKLYMRDWLDAPSMAEQQGKGRSARKNRPESGRWLLLRDKVKSWLEPTFNVAACLWIHGIPGAGKTVLASLLVEECKNLPHAKTIYFYCRNGDCGKDNFISMSRSLIEQLSELEGSVIDILYEMAMKNELCFNTRKSAKKLLQLCLEATGPVYMVLDGLDECVEPEQKAIARWLKKYVDNSAGTLDPCRCVFLSQDDAFIRSLLSTVPAVRITSTDNSTDIKAYCTVMARRIQVKFRHVVDTEADYIVEAVSSKANGESQPLFYAQFDNMD